VRIYSPVQDEYLFVYSDANWQMNKAFAQSVECFLYVFFIFHEALSQQRVVLADLSAFVVSARQKDLLGERYFQSSQIEKVLH
jgi:hypothetical protein